VKKFSSQVDSPDQAMVFSRTSSNDGGVLPHFTEEFEVVIIIAVVTEEMHGSDRVSDLKRSRREPWLERQFSSRVKSRSCSRACASVVENN
jgi:hypothetical protein